MNDYLLNDFLNWLDLLWVPLALLIVRKKQRINAVIFVLSCVFALRLQVELMGVIGFDNGFLPFLDYPQLYRGYVVYGVIIAFFLFLSRWSRERDPYINMAVAITVFIAAFCISTFIMVL